MLAQAIPQPDPAAAEPSFADAAGDTFEDISLRLHQHLVLLKTADERVHRGIFEKVLHDERLPGDLGRVLNAETDRVLTLLEIIDREINSTKSVLDGLHQRFLRERQGRVARATEPHQRSAWEGAVVCLQDRGDKLAKAASDSETDSAASRYQDAVLSLYRTRAPDLDALREKVRVARDWNVTSGAFGEDILFTQLLADIDNLN